MRVKPLIVFICAVLSFTFAFYLLRQAEREGGSLHLTSEGRQLEAFLQELHENAAAEGHEPSTEDLRKALEDIDDYSRYLDPDELNSFAIQTEQEYVGIGIRLAQSGSYFIVSEVFEGGPSDLAGLNNGDRIASVNGEPISQLSIQEVVKRLRGKDGTEVELLIYSPSEESHMTKTVKRGKVALNTVNDYHMLDDSIGYVRLDSFGLRSKAEIATALSELNKTGMTQLVLDLRDNPGGVLKAGVAVADLFLDPGTEIISTKAANDSDHKAVTYSASTPALTLHYPIIVLINKHSASAAEIVAGALQQADRAILIGDRTIGKGSIQSVYTLPNGQGIKMTTAHYYLPDGKSIDGTGIAPDILLAITEAEWTRLYVDHTHRPRMSEEEYAQRFPEGTPPDRQLELAIETLKSRQHLDSN